MATHTIKKGLDLPITGAPEQRVEDGNAVTKVAIVAPDYVGMRPKMLVGVGDKVKRGQPIFEDRKNPGVVFTAPGAGRVSGVNRGAKRALLSVVVELSEGERAGKPAPDELAAFTSHRGTKPSDYDREQLVALLIESGMFPVLRQRPYGRVPDPKKVPSPSS